MGAGLGEDVVEDSVVGGDVECEVLLAGGGEVIEGEAPEGGGGWDGATEVGFWSGEMAGAAGGCSWIDKQGAGDGLGDGGRGISSVMEISGVVHAAVSGVSGVVGVAGSVVGRGVVLGVVSKPAPPDAEVDEISAVAGPVIASVVGVPAAGREGEG